MSNLGGGNINSNQSVDQSSTTSTKGSNQLINIMYYRNNFSEQQQERQKGLGFWASLFTFIKVNVVAGFLFLPHGFLLGGWLFSVIAIILVSIIIIYCNISLSDCTEVAKTYSFATVGEKAMGKFGKYFVEYGIAISQVIKDIFI